MNLLEKNIIPEGPVKEALKIKGIKSIQFVGKIRTYRFEVFHKEYTIVLDKNEYENIVDYNLEIESDSEAKSIEIMKTTCNDNLYDENTACLKDSPIFLPNLPFSDSAFFSTEVNAYFYNREVVERKSLVVCLEVYLFKGFACRLVEFYLN